MLFSVCLSIRSMISLPLPSYFTAKVIAGCSTRLPHELLPSTVKVFSVRGS